MGWVVALHGASKFDDILVFEVARIGVGADTADLKDLDEVVTTHAIRWRLLEATYSTVQYSTTQHVVFMRGSGGGWVIGSLVYWIMSYGSTAVR